MRFGKISSIGGRLAAPAVLAPAVLALAILAPAASSMPALAADPVFPTADRIGLVPPPGMVKSATFPGFEDATKKAIILLTAMPPGAYAEINKTLAADVLKKQGFSVEKREPIKLSFGEGFVIVGTVTIDQVRYHKWLLAAPAGDLTVLASVQIPPEQDKTYSDAVVHAALSSLVVRKTIPDAEFLSLMPFTVGDLAGFHVSDIIPGNAIMLVDPSADQKPDAPVRELNARFTIIASEGGPAEAADRAEFARVGFYQIAGIKSVRISVSEPLRIGGQPGFQTMAQAKDSRTDTDLMVVQWLRFGGGGFLRMVGIARAENWVAMLARLRTIRDSIEPK